MIFEKDVRFWKRGNRNIRLKKLEGEMVEGLYVRFSNWGRKSAETLRWKYSHELWEFLETLMGVDWIWREWIHYFRWSAQILGSNHNNKGFWLSKNINLIHLKNNESATKTLACLSKPTVTRQKHKADRFDFCFFCFAYATFWKNGIQSTLFFSKPDLDPMLN